MRWMLLIVLAAAAAWGAEPTASWEGLVGGYTMPTARTYPRRTVSVKFAEIRFCQESQTTKLHDTSFSGLITISTGPRWEACLLVRNTLLRVEPLPGEAGDVFEADDDYFTGSLKAIIRRPRPGRVGVALGVMDIADATNTVRSFDPQRGRRAFLVGTLDWFSAGATYSDERLGGYWVMNFTAAEGVEVIAEYNTHPVFAQLADGASNPNNFNLGLRLRPREVPAGHIDIAMAGDGVFSFSFALGFEAPSGAVYPTRRVQSMPG